MMVLVGRNTAVSGIYRLKVQAERALDTLIAGGLPCSSISVLLLDPADAGGTGGGNSAMGCGAAAIGGTIGVLAGVGLVAIPGAGQMIGAGPIMAGFAGANSPDVARALVGIGIPELEAKHYEAEVRNGGTLLSLSCNSIEQASRAKKLLTVTGAIGAPLEPERTATWGGVKL
jgi:hypothetical protein